MVLSAFISTIVFTTFRTIAFENFKNNITDDFHQRIVRIVLITGRAAHEIYSHNTLKVYNSYVNEIKEVTGNDLFSVDPATLLSIDHRQIPPPLLEVIKTTAASNNLEIQRIKNKLYMAEWYPESHGTPQIIIAAIHTSGPPPPNFPPPKDSVSRPNFMPPSFLGRDIIIALIVVIATSLVCYFLAKSLTSPLRSLRRTTQKIASGELSARTKTERIKTVKEIEDLSNDFDVMAEKVELLINSQKRLLRDISHELRSPLARLHIALELLKNSTGSQANNISRIERESFRINDLIGQLLDFARYENGNTKVIKQNFNLIKLIKKITKDALFEAEQSKEILLEYDPKTIENVKVHCNYELISSAIENIIRNGIKYTKQFSQINISIFLENETTICVQIEDSGPGIPADKIAQVTQPFYRVEDSRNRQSGGAGIGLAIAQQAIKLNDGWMYIYNSKRQKGLTVQVFLPLLPSK